MLALSTATRGTATAQPPPEAAPAPSPGNVLVFAGLPFAVAEQKAIVASPEVEGAKARVAENQYALAAARAGTTPSLVANYVQAPQGNPPGPNITSRQLTTGIAISIADLIAYSPAVREAAFALAAAQFDESTAESLERVKVAGLYFGALKARAIADARRSALDVAKRQREAARIRYAAGDAPQLDVVRADVGLSRAQADVEIATADDLNATAALAIETNVEAASLDATGPESVTPTDVPLTDPTAAVALARATRPEIASARRTADAAGASIRSARAAAFPALTVTGGYLTGTDSGVSINAPTINAQLTLPLPASNRDRVLAAEARALEARTKAASVERQIALDVAASARTLGAAQRAAAATTRARQAAQLELQATETGYRNGASSSLEVTGARATYAQAVVDELSALYDLQKARAILDVEVRP